MVYTEQGKEMLNTLVKEINNFDLYYEMSDSHSVYEQGHNEKSKIILKIKNLIPSEKVKINKKLNSNGKNCWNRYFKNY